MIIPPSHEESWSSEDVPATLEQSPNTLTRDSSWLMLTTLQVQWSDLKKAVDSLRCTTTAGASLKKTPRAKSTPSWEASFWKLQRTKCKPSWESPFASVQRLEGVRVRCTVTLHSKVSSNYAEKPVMQRKDRLMTKSESELVKCSVFLASLQHVHAHRLIRSVYLKACLMCQASTHKIGKNGLVWLQGSRNGAPDTQGRQASA
jgi:hypothetical protein